MHHKNCSEYAVIVIISPIYAMFIHVRAKRLTRTSTETVKEFSAFIFVNVDAYSALHHGPKDLCLRL